MPNPTPKRAAVLLAGTALAIACATAARAETLGDAIAYAYQTNPGLQAQRAALRALDETYVAARGQYGPSVSVSASATDESDRRKGGGTDIFGQPNPTFKSNFNSTGASLSVVQPLYSGGRAVSQVRAAEAQIMAGRETLRRFEQDLLNRVTTAYVDVLRDQQVLAINRDAVATLNKEFSDTQARFKVREVTKTDLSQAQARLAQARTQLLNAQAQLGISRAAFLGVVGQSPGELAPPPAVDPLPAGPDQAYDAAEANNPQLQAARYTELGSRAAVEAAKAQRMPQVTARFDMQRTPELPYQNLPYDNIMSGSVTLSQPIFTAGQINSGIRRSVEENNRDRLTIDDARLQVIQQVSTAWEQLVALRQQLVTAQDEMTADEVAYAGVRQEERVALRSTIDVLNAELELSTAQQNVARVRAAEYLSRVQLLQAIGVLTPEMLSANVTHYDAAANFRKVKDAGRTPLEFPIYGLEYATTPKLGPEPPASIAQGTPGGPALPPPPQDADKPIVSIYSTIEQQTAPAGTAPKGPSPGVGPAAAPTSSTPH
jgi:TolC family type I secretion outer membrane protein